MCCKGVILWKGKPIRHRPAFPMLEESLLPTLRLPTDTLATRCRVVQHDWDIQGSADEATLTCCDAALAAVAVK